MAGTLHIDHVELDQTYKDLLHTSVAFDSSEHMTDIGEALGHDGLAHRVAAVSSEWRLRRAEVSQSLDALWRAAQQINATFGEVDSLAAAQLQS